MSLTSTQRHLSLLHESPEHFVGGLSVASDTVLCRFRTTSDVDKPSRSMAMREATAISCNCCSCRSLTVGFQICELRHRLEGWAACCSCVIGRFCHIPPLLVSWQRPETRTRSSGGSGRPDPPLRPVGLHLAVHPSEHQQGNFHGALSGLSGSSTSPPRKNAMIKREFGRVRASISSSPRLRRTCGRLPSGPPRCPRVRGAARRYARTAGVQSQLSEGPNPPCLARWLRHCDFLVAAASSTAAGPGAEPPKG
jgi:hypothetical protein